MIKKVCLALVLSISIGIRAENEVESLGNALVRAANVTAMSSDTLALASQLIDVFIANLDLTSEQWDLLHKLAVEGEDLMKRKTSKGIMNLQEELSTEIQSLGELFDADQNNSDIQELVQSAFTEIQNNPKYAPLISLLKDEQAYAVQIMQKLFEGTDAQLVDMFANLDLLMPLIKHIVVAVEKRAASY